MNIRVVFVLASLLFAHSMKAQESSDIYLGKLNFWDKQAVSDLVRVTNSADYTNQPYFFGHDKIYFTQAVKQDEIEQMDIFVYDMMSKKVTNLTQSPESEFSPTPLTSGKGMSVIRVSAEGKQELWSLDEKGKPLQHLVPAIEPVGYQVWLNKNELLLFVLGEPNTLQRVDIRSGNTQTTVVDNTIGRSLYQFENSNWFLYSQTEKGNKLKAYNRRTNKTLVVTDLPKDSSYFSLSATGHVITSDGNNLYQRKLIVKGDRLEAQESWKLMPILTEKCQSGISRTAISKHGGMIALVCPH
jgi:Tol biopolymer transport system component